MLKKSYSKTGSSCRVTFKVADVEADQIAVLGEWNDWSPASDVLKKRKDGTFSTTISLDAGREYRFRYLADGQSWLNDDEADSFAPNRFGSADCVLEV